MQHRDVKPANLLLLDSALKVADFGLAKNLLQQTMASNSGGGTIAYLLRPNASKGKLTQQTDQYSLAVTYYHLRTGRLLFKGDQAQMMYVHLELNRICRTWRQPRESFLREHYRKNRNRGLGRVAAIS